MLLWCFPATASSRVVVSTTEPVQLFVDGMLIPTSIGNIRSAIPHVVPGNHVIAIHDLLGHLKHKETVMVPEGADVRINWAPGGKFQITGADPANDAPSTIVGASAGPTTDIPTSAPVHTKPRGESSVEALRSSASRAPSVGAVTSIVTGSGVAGLAAGAAASGVRSLTYGAKAGTSFGDPVAVPQRIIRPNVVYGKVRFIKSGGGPVVIYENGMLVARLEAGAVELDLSIEVGRRELEIRSGSDNRVLYQGDLQVERGHHIQLSVGEATPPRALQRPWLYKDSG